MKKTHGIFIAIVLLASGAAASAQAQNIEKLELGRNCNFIGRLGVGDNVYLFPPHEETEAGIAEIADSMGIQPAFEVRAANIKNAAATVADGKLWILYHPDFREKLTKETGNKAAFIGVLAHEIAHHVQSHLSVDDRDMHVDELWADSYSGRAMFRLGYSLDDAQAAIKELSSEKESETHPPKSARLLAVRQGFEMEQDLAYKIGGAVSADNEKSIFESAVDKLTDEEKAAFESVALKLIDSSGDFGNISLSIEEKSVVAKLSAAGAVSVGDWIAENGPEMFAKLANSFSEDSEGQGDSPLSRPVNAADANGITPLHSAAYNNKTDDMIALVEAGADVNVRTKKGNSPLHNAAYNGHLDAISALIAANADVNAANETGETPLHSAAYKGLSAAVKTLIAAGANVDAKDGGGVTPLMLAAEYGKADAIRALLDGGADVSASINRGCDVAIVRATAGGHAESVKVMLDYGAKTFVSCQVGYPVMGVAAAYGHADIAKILIDAGADVNARSDSGSTPLMDAAHNGRSEVARLLILAGANLDLEGDPLGTALMNAAHKGYAEIARMLIVAGADVNKANYSGETALDFAVRAGHDTIVSMLWNAGGRCGHEC